MTAFSLSLSRPSLQARSCALCRVYYFDESTGMPERNRDGRGYMPRRGPVPCEASVGCPKGHWKDKPDLSKAQQSIIDLFWACRSGTARLKRGDMWLSNLFGQFERAIERSRSEALIAITGRLTALGGK